MYLVVFGFFVFGQKRMCSQSGSNVQVKIFGHQSGGRPRPVVVRPASPWQINNA